MSFPPGVPLPITRPLYATTTVQSGPMMVQMAPARQVAMVPVSQVMVQPVMRPVISQAQQAFVPAMQAQQITSMMTNPAQVVQSGNQQIWIQSPDVQSNSVSKKSEGNTEGTDATTNQPPTSVENSSDPAITVFVGNITDRASDTLIRQILMKCGLVYTWKRVQGTSGKLQAFGFCEYRDPESALRAIYVLHDYMLGDKKLLVKVDSKTQGLIDEWKKQKGIKSNNEDDDTPRKPSGVEEAQAGIQLLIQEYSTELNAPKVPIESEELPVLQLIKPDPTVRESQNIEQNLQELELEEEQKNFISKEIRSFRESQKLQEEKQRSEKADKEKKSSKESSSRSRDSKNERDDRDRARARSPRTSSYRTRSPSPRRETRRTRSPPRRKRSRTPPRRSPVRSISRRSRSPVRRKRSVSRSPVSRRRGDEDDDSAYEAHERRKLERKIREKETAYQERLRAYEIRERRMKRNYEKRDDQEKRERKEMVREAKRLREFLADYEDDRSDNKYYVGNSLTKRLREREREIETDDRDRKKEKEEIEVLRKRLIEEDHSDPESAIAKAISESEGVWKPLIEPDTPPRKSPSPAAPARAASSSSSDDGDSGSDDSDEKSDSDSSDSNEDEKQETIVKTNADKMVPSLQPVTEEIMHVQSPVVVKPVEQAVVKMEFNSRSSPAQTTPAQSNSASDSPHVIGTVKPEPAMETIVPTSLSSKRRKLKVSDVFNQDEEEDELPKRRKLVPLQYTDEERKALNPIKTAEDERKLAEEKRKLVRALIERIPTQKDDLFDYNLDWSMVDATLMEKRIQPWITKKIMEYIGEEEPTLVEFICSKIMTKSSPEKILEDISMVLDDEADVFVVKMWRLLIYETEAKKEGLTK